jgi:hypothetical protein
MDTGAAESSGSSVEEGKVPIYKMNSDDQMGWAIRQPNGDWFFDFDDLHAAMISQMDVSSFTIVVGGNIRAL